MSKIAIIAKKELAAYFKSPTAYIILILCISIFNIFFFMIIDESREVSLRDVFKVMGFIFVFLVPLLTMRTFSEEKLTGTMEFLMTTPTTNTAIVLGKYLASLIFFTLLLSMTSVYYLIIEYFGQPDRLATFSGYIGVWLEGAFFLSIGILTSAWTRNQIVAAISSYTILFILYFSSTFIKYFSGTAEMVIRYVSTVNHVENFAVGIVTIADPVYYISGVVLCLVLTRFSIENRLWR